jgi:ABC-type cobalamin transport system ATPase subunit
MAGLIKQFTELLTEGSVVIESSNLKSFHKCASAHGMRYEVGPNVAGKSVLITI